jgi:hypothetical protein
MEAYLDWQKSGGIKLNDVIEEYRYVANGQTVKKGDFLTYVGEDVAPATEPPFNAIALSSGVGGTDTEHNEQVKIARVYKEVEKTFTDNAFPTIWNEEVTGTKYNSNGYTLEASSYFGDNRFQVYYISDNDISDTQKRWIAADGKTGYVIMTCPNPIKITKMKTRIMARSSSANVLNAQIQGSNDNALWDNLFSITGAQSEMTEVILNNANYYRYYRIYITMVSTNDAPSILEWQTSEYIVKEVIQ